MDINLYVLVRVSVLLFVSLILPLRLALADDNSLSTPDYDTLLSNANTCDANQDYSGAFSDEVQAVELNPDRGDGVARLLQTLTQTTPTTISVTALTALPVKVVPIEVSMNRTEPGVPNSLFQTIIITPDSALPSEVDDPVDGWPFNRAMYIYSTDGADKATLLCTIHYQTGDYAAIARRMGALLALLDKVYTEKMLVSRADDSYAFDVWLCPTAPVSNGGEQWRNNIYFYDVTDSRSSIEWIREIAHEFSHLAFHAVGGSYTNPEAFANGYLGERLLVRWISRGAGGGGQSLESVWRGTFAGYYNFNRLLIAPPIADFKAFGLNKSRLKERDAKGMRYLIGMMLTIDDRFGSAAVGQLLQALADQHSSDPNLLYDPVHALLRTTLAGNKVTHAAN
jgi:hypothetical protein